MDRGNFKHAHTLPREHIYIPLNAHPSGNGYFVYSLFRSLAGTNVNVRNSRAVHRIRVPRIHEVRFSPASPLSGYTHLKSDTQRILELCQKWRSFARTQPTLDFIRVR